MIRIGVIGHREIANLEANRNSVQQVLCRILQCLHQRNTTSPEFVILSPLAEGADRLVAKEALVYPGARLEVALPLSIEEYLADFKSQKSKAEFSELLNNAHKVHSQPSMSSRQKSYEAVGKFVVDNSDVLIALWNGRKGRGRGGTSEMITYTRSLAKPLYWINTEKLSSKNFQEEYERENPSSVRLSEKVKEEKEKYKNFLKDAFSQTGASEKEDAAQELYGRLEERCNFFLPYFAKADLLADKYHWLYRFFSKTIYILAALAVMIISAQFLFHLPHWTILGEIGAMLIVIGIITYGNHVGWHRRWLDYRLLAERLRFAIVTAFLDEVHPSNDREPDLDCGLVEEVWSIGFYRKILEKCPLLPSLGSINKKTLAILKHFINRSVLNDQRIYHERKSGAEFRNHKFISLGGELCFWLTLISASLHFSHIGTEFAGRILTFFAIAFPAAGSVFAALRAHFEYKKNSERSDMTALRLADIQLKVLNSTSMQSIQILILEAESLMLEENADWHVAMSIHHLETPA